MVIVGVLAGATLNIASLAAGSLLACSFDQKSEPSELVAHIQRKSGCSTFQRGKNAAQQNRCGAAGMWAAWQCWQSDGAVQPGTTPCEAFPGAIGGVGWLHTT